MLPKRLLHIYDAGGKGDLSASLCQGSTLPSDTPYLTLSHRWGKQEFLKLTQENISQLEKHIPMDELSPTFRDAFYMTYSLGFSYIWIDSLCILQDDKQDWRQESEAMRRIYKGAACNIAAFSNQEDKEQGFLPLQRQIHPIVPPLVHIGWHASPSSAKSEALGRDFVITQKYPAQCLNDDDLYSRAWTFQEQLLVSGHVMPSSSICSANLNFEGSTHTALPGRPDLLGMQNIHMQRSMACGLERVLESR